MLRNFNIAHRIASRRYRAKRRARARGRVFTDNTILPVANIPISEDNLAPLYSNWAISFVPTPTSVMLHL